MKLKKIFIYSVIVVLSCSFLKCIFSTEPNYRDKRKLVYEYADNYWSQDKWESWLNNLSESEQNMFAHELPAQKNKRYYEMIWKYSQFLVGWADVPDDIFLDEIFEYTSSHRMKYIELWEDAGL